MFKLSAEETILVSQILAEIRVKHCNLKLRQKEASVRVEDAINLLQGSKLSSEVLWHILALADKNESEYLEREDLGVVVRLIGWAQVGVQTSRAWINRCGPTAVISGLPVLRELKGSPKITSTSSSIRRESDGRGYPPFSAQQRAKFVKIFQMNIPAHGVLTAQRVWSVLTMSKLPAFTLAEIWDLVDTKGSGELTMTEFLIAMYFIDGLMHKQFSTLPSSVPSHIYEQAANPSLDLGPVAGPSDLDYHIYPDRSKKTRRQTKPRWEISPVIQANAATHLNSLDPEATGQITREAFLNYLDEQCVPSAEGNRIWNLVDILETPTITQDEYAVALFFMHRHLAGIELPDILPLVLIPPSIRSHSSFQSSFYNDKDWDPEARRPTNWHISEPIHHNATRMFSVLDFENHGYIKPYPVIALMKESKLPAEDLTQIWRLLGLREKNRITLHLFTVMLFFIHWRLAGLNLPDTLPDTLKASSPPSSPPTHPSRTLSVEPDMLLSVQDCRNSLRELTTENQRLRQHRQSLKCNGRGSALLTLLTAPARLRRPLPRPVSVPLSDLDTSFQSGSSEPTSPSLSTAPSNDLRSEVDQLKLTIQSLMMENAMLRNSVYEIQHHQRERERSVSLINGQEPDGVRRESSSTVDVTEGDNLPPPPPYEEWSTDSGS